MFQPSRLCSIARLLPGLPLAFLLPGTGCAQKGAPAPAAPAPAVVVAQVVQKTVPVYAEFVARTDASSSVELVARVEGFLLAKSFQEGHVVHRGQVVYRIDSAQYDANVMSAKAKVAQAQAQLMKADQDVERYRPLAAGHAIPQQDLDTALANQMASQADLQSAQAGLVQANLNLSYCTIVSPIEGIIGRSTVDTGNLVGRGSATVLDTVSTLDPIKVTFGIPEAGWLNLAKRRGKGSSTEVRLVLADNSLYPRPGRFTFLDRAVDLKTGTLQVECEFPNPDGLIRPNQFGRVRVVSDTAQDAFLIPQKAVMEQQGAKAVYVVGPDNKVAQRTVVLGPVVRSWFIVSEGLKAGEQVIVEGQQKAHPGATVVPAWQAASAEPSGD